MLGVVGVKADADEGLSYFFMQIDINCVIIISDNVWQYKLFSCELSSFT